MGEYAVITTVAGPTMAMRTLGERLAQFNWRLVVAGDKKGPSVYPLPNTEFLGVERQVSLQSELAALLPYNHYARKNIGYLFAMSANAAMIYETDDDNAPLSSWAPRQDSCAAISCVRKGWVNVYRHFTNETIWPRGLPLDQIDSAPELAGESRTVTAPVQQGLANGSPDVDAVWRLTMERGISFHDAPSVFLPSGCWCPFNSQSTWWWPEAYPLMYLPSHCSFRMTDIWRSFVAQRCLWEMGAGVVFHGAEVNQERNVHDLMQDFRDEVPGYLGNKAMAELLESIDLDGKDCGVNLLACYRALVEAGYFPAAELDLVSAWLQDIHGVMAARKGETVASLG